MPNTPSIATNIAHSISPEEIQRISQEFSELGPFSIHEYSTKAVGVSDFVQFIFSDFSIRTLIRDALVWHVLTSLAAKLVRIASTVRRAPNSEVLFWFRDTSGLPAINISFSASSDVQATIALSELRREVGEEIFLADISEDAATTFLWISKRGDVEPWKIQVLKLPKGAR